MKTLSFSQTTGFPRSRRRARHGKRGFQIPWSLRLARHGKQGFRGPDDGIPWSRGRVRHGKQGFRGPGGVRGMENRVSVVSAACQAWTTGLRGPGCEAWETGFRGPGGVRGMEDYR
jgi:hypothetical protein